MILINLRNKALRSFALQEIMVFQPLNPVNGSIAPVESQAGGGRNWYRWWPSSTRSPLVCWLCHAIVWWWRRLLIVVALVRLWNWLLSLAFLCLFFHLTLWLHGSIPIRAERAYHHDPHFLSTYGFRPTFSIPTEVANSVRISNLGLAMQ